MCMGYGDNIKSSKLVRAIFSSYDMQHTHTKRHFYCHFPALKCVLCWTDWIVHDLAQHFIFIRKMDYKPCVCLVNRLFARHPNNNNAAHKKIVVNIKYFSIYRSFAYFRINDFSFKRHRESLWSTGAQYTSSFFSINIHFCGIFVVDLFCLPL